MFIYYVYVLLFVVGDVNVLLNWLLFCKFMLLLIVVYVISFFDCINIVFVKYLMGVDFGILLVVYGFGVGLFFLIYVFFEILSNLIMYCVGVCFWIMWIMIMWGVLLVVMVFVSGEMLFYVMCLLLGVVEVGLFFGVMLYLMYWFGCEECVCVIGYFLFGVCIVNIVGGLLVGVLIEFDGMFGFYGW